MPAPIIPTIETERLILRAPTPADAAPGSRSSPTLISVATYLNRKSPARQRNAPNASSASISGAGNHNR